MWWWYILIWQNTYRYTNWEENSEFYISSEFLLYTLWLTSFFRLSDNFINFGKKMLINQNELNFNIHFQYFWFAYFDKEIASVWFRLLIWNNGIHDDWQDDSEVWVFLLFLVFNLPFFFYLISWDLVILSRTWEFNQWWHHNTCVGYFDHFEAFRQEFLKVHFAAFSNISLIFLAKNEKKMLHQII